MSTLAIDTPANRSNERLSAFLTEIGTNMPIDNIFVRFPVLDLLMKKKKTVNGGRQILYPIDSGTNSTVKDFSDYDTFDTSAQDTARTVAYPFVNKGGTLVISWEEQRETAGQDHAIFDLVAHKRNNLMKTAMDQISTDLFAASAVTSKISSLNVMIDSTGTIGGLSQSTDSDWAASEIGSGSFVTQGLADMRTLWNTLFENGGNPNTIVTNRTIYQFYENEIDPDVRYSSAQGVGGRGFKTLEFKGIPIIFDAKGTSGVLYMWDDENLFMMVDSDGDMAMDPFITPSNQKVSVSKLVFRANLICNRRRGTGKLTGVTA